MLLPGTELPDFIAYTPSEGEQVYEQEDKHALEKILPSNAEVSGQKSKDFQFLTAKYLITSPCRTSDKPLVMISAR